MGWTTVATAQTTTPPMPLPRPEHTEATAGDGVSSGSDEASQSIEDFVGAKSDPYFTDTLVPYAPPTHSATGSDVNVEQGALFLMAKLTSDSEPLDQGLVWRIYSETTGDDGRLELIATAEGGNAEFRLNPGAYLIHTSYGFASATNRIVMRRDVESKMVILNAGGIKMEAALGENLPLEGRNVTFSIYGMEFNARGERNLIAGDILPGQIIRLNAETYHVISRYGRANAIIRADIQVVAGKLTEATMIHKAADITLKLVSSPGGEAIANTSWSVLSPGGDVIVEANGAFPDVVLATGEYEVVAKNNGEIYTSLLNVENGVDTEFEVVTATSQAQVSN
ncbi:MAG: hypothetical protein HWE23_05995 [Rhodobacteraceae bacterium]|nr:hypothetical protein [Paracoccaceae bacterium]